MRLRSSCFEASTLLSQLNHFKFSFTLSFSVSFLPPIYLPFICLFICLSICLSKHICIYTCIYIYIIHMYTLPTHLPWALRQVLNMQCTHASELPQKSQVENLLFENIVWTLYTCTYTYAYAYDIYDILYYCDLYFIYNV